MPPRLSWAAAIGGRGGLFQRLPRAFSLSAQVKASDSPNDASKSAISRVLSLDSSPPASTSSPGTSPTRSTPPDRNAALRSLLSASSSSPASSPSSTTSSNASSYPNNPFAAATLAAATRRQGAMARARATAEEELRRHRASESLTRAMYRRWRTGDVYAPRDLRANQLARFQQGGRDSGTGIPQVDLVDVLGVNPLDLYSNFSVISQFVTKNGRIKPPKETGLRPVNQRRMAKAIRRAIGLGLHPSVYRHPEILMREARLGNAMRRR